MHLSLLFSISLATLFVAPLHGSRHRKRVASLAGVLDCELSIGGSNSDVGSNPASSGISNGAVGTDNSALAGAVTESSPSTPAPQLPPTAVASQQIASHSTDLEIDSYHVGHHMTRSASSYPSSSEDDRVQRGFSTLHPASHCSVSVIDANAQGGAGTYYGLYALKTVVDDSGRTVIVQRRCTQFLELMEYLLKRFPERMVPHLSDVQSAMSFAHTIAVQRLGLATSQSLESRRVVLGHFVQLIHAHPVLRLDNAVRGFLTSQNSAFTIETEKQSVGIMRWAIGSTMHIMAPLFEWLYRQTHLRDIRQTHIDLLENVHVAKEDPHYPAINTCLQAMAFSTNLATNLEKLLHEMHTVTTKLKFLGPDIGLLSEQLRSMMQLGREEHDLSVSLPATDAISGLAQLCQAFGVDLEKPMVQLHRLQYQNTTFSAMLERSSALIYALYLQRTTIVRVEPESSGEAKTESSSSSQASSQLLRLRTITENIHEEHAFLKQLLAEFSSTVPPKVVSLFRIFTHETHSLFPDL